MATTKILDWQQASEIGQKLRKLHDKKVMDFQYEHRKERTAVVPENLTYPAWKPVAEKSKNSQGDILTTLTVSWLSQEELNAVVEDTPQRPIIGFSGKDKGIIPLV
jgi:hypothetical protein